MSTAPPAQDDHVTPELPEVVVGEWEETLRELQAIQANSEGNRPALSGPSAWNQGFTVSDIPERVEDRQRLRGVSEVKPESPGSTGSRDLAKNPKQGQQDLTPGSARSGSTWNQYDLSDDDVSICTKYDRGYTAAEKRYTDPNWTPGHATTESLTSINVAPSSGSSLEPLIHGSIQSYGGRPEREKEWLPFDKLFELINEDRVFQELLRVLGTKMSGDDLRSYRDKICSGAVYEDHNNNRLRTSSRCIFAILTLMDKVQSAPEFVDAGLSDKDLPLGHDRTHPTTPFYSISPPRTIWSVAQHWPNPFPDLFITFQKLMLSPFFELRSREVPFYDLHDSAVLPFIEDSEKDQKIRPRHGHHGNVWRVKIHRAHHDWVEDDDPYFAVKELNSLDNDGKQFKDEVNAWAKSVGVTGHPHLINLLATWRQNQRWYLLFPWASGGNLRDFWFNPDIHRPDPSLVRWIAKQCLGIAEALRKIHRTGSGDVQDRSPFCGIHGDIKPENVLLFEDADDEHGILKICDFGFTRFHTRASRSAADLPGYTPTYRAPEYDINRRVSAAYDVWTLGCLYLEFITWYLTGPEGVADHFESLRVKEDRGEYVPMDKFFVCASINQVDNLGAIIKPCVLIWIRHLRSLDQCSRFFQDFLDIIEKDLLVINPKSRKKCDKLVHSLREINERCMKKGESYFFVGSPKPMSETADHVRNFPVPFPYPAEEVKKMTSLNDRLPAVSREGHVRYDNTVGHDNTWMVRSGASGEGPNTNFSDVLTNGPAKQSKLAIKGSIILDQEPGEENQTEIDGESNEETPLLSKPRVSRETFRSASHILTRSPESIERINHTTNPPAVATQPTDPPSSESMKTQDQQRDHLSSQNWEPLPHNQTTANAPTTEIPSDGSHKPRLCRSLNVISRISGLLGSWFSHWFGCGRPRIKSDNRTDAENG